MLIELENIYFRYWQILFAKKTNTSSLAELPVTSLLKCVNVACTFKHIINKQIKISKIVIQGGPKSCCVVENLVERIERCGWS